MKKITDEQIIKALEYCSTVVSTVAIDNLVKEMTEEEK